MITQHADKIIFDVRIIPNSSKNDIIHDDDMIKIKLTAQPLENKANKALIGFLSKLLRVPKTKINIVKGEQSKNKTILISEENTLKQKDIVIKLKKEYNE